MCGICGVFDLSGRPVEEQLIQKMNLILKHRGPDGEGTFVDGEFGFGHRRLSIIDLSGGAQPIGNEDDSLQVVFNGEIYNFIELRNELVGFGHQFKTLSDTEVIVHAYEQWGKECVRRFNGMFAFALWDARTRSVFLARDHLGIKPLYYINLGNRILFASEIKSLLQDPQCPCDIDIEALAQLFTFRFVPSPGTVFERIRKLQPGHWMSLSSRGIEIQRFWDWIPRIREHVSEGELIEEYCFLLEDAVRLQLRSDVPLGLFLSSGVDSGVLLAIMRKYSLGPVEAFTIGFEGGEKTNEVEGARQTAEMFGARHNYMMISPEDYLKYYEKYLWDMEEPLGHEPAAAFYFLSRMTSQHVKVALTGQGADEPWGGYTRYLGVKLSNFYSRMPAPITNGFASLLGRLPGRHERLRRGLVSLAERDLLTRFAKIYSFFSADMKRELYKGPLRKYLEGDGYSTKEALRHLQTDVRHLDPLTQMLYMDTRASLPDDLLMVADKASMANSLEVRVPFLDYRLVEFIESLPPNLKVKGLTGKYLHKKAVLKWLPKKVVYSKKKGFSHPIENWLRDAMRPYVEECLLSPDSGCALFFDQQYIRGMLQRDREGKEQYKRHIYLLVSFELWYRTFMRK